LTAAFVVFHLNLAYSSIAVASRPTVIRRCYHPLLDLAERTGIPIGIEATGWTLRQIQQLDRNWIERLRVLLAAGRCELVGSGYVQLIGPLVPHEVNVWNQQLGVTDYRDILDVRPPLALVNEMAYSSGLPAIYRQAGYQGIVMDRDNVRLALDLEDSGYESVPAVAQGIGSDSIPVLWSDSILFQKLQRIAHGDISLDDYLAYFRRRAVEAIRPLAVYCNDAEIFDFRPGRFREESVLHAESEWQRIEHLLATLARREGVRWLAPSDALRESLQVCPGPPRCLTSIAQPIPVKKQAKYNVSRWAVTGRDDLLLNTLCHRIYRRLQGTSQPEPWRQLCELWASDLRTHTTEDRWRESRAMAESLAGSIDPAPAKTDTAAAQTVATGSHRRIGEFDISVDADDIFATVRGPRIHLVLNLRRGATIHSLAFASHGFVPVLGTRPHGYFDSIEVGADFYSAGAVIELPSEHRRATDLERVVPGYSLVGEVLQAVVSAPTSCGPIEKVYSIDVARESVDIAYRFPDWSPRTGIFRVGTLTFFPEALGADLALECVNGGDAPEHFLLDRSVDHSHPASSLVSSTTGFGATTGFIRIGGRARSVGVEWEPARCAAFPMLVHKRVRPTSLTRILFSLGELDETSHPRSELPTFAFSITPMQGFPGREKDLT
jgi:hypothetical protein